jgi:hypothetical protein
MSRIFLIAFALLAFASNAAAQQGAKYERWSGQSMPDPQSLANSPTMLGTPTVTQTLVNFDAPVNVAGSFVARITARVVVPETGTYIFWDASNGTSKSWWSTDQNFANKTPMARMMQTVYPSKNQWTRHCEQKSGTPASAPCPGGVVNPAVTLTAGQTIYVMLIYSDSVVEAGTNINHAGLKWQLPSGLQEGPIPGARITVPPTQTTPAPTVNLTANPTTVTGTQATTLSWSTSNATSCTASNNGSVTAWTGSKSISGTQSMSLTQSTTFTLSCTGAGGTTTANATVTRSTSTGTVTIAWNANPESDLAGYQIQYGTTSGNPSTTVDVGNVTQRQLTGLSGTARYYFRVLAYNTSGQVSAPSNEVSWLPTGAIMSNGDMEVVLTEVKPGTRLPQIGEVSPSPYDDPAYNQPSWSEPPQKVMTDAEVRDTQDYWIDRPEEFGWRNMMNALWYQKLDQQPVIIQKDWTLSLDPNVKFPGPTISPDQLLDVPEGTHLWARTTYVPDGGQSYATVSRPEGGFIRATRLVWLHHVVVGRSEVRRYPVAAVAELENGEGYSLFVRSQEGKWSAGTLTSQATFGLFMPNAANWTAPQNVEEPVEANRQPR